MERRLRPRAESVLVARGGGAAIKLPKDKSKRSTLGLSNRATDRETGASSQLTQRQEGVPLVKGTTKGYATNQSEILKVKQLQPIQQPSKRVDETGALDQFRDLLEKSYIIGHHDVEA